MTIQGGTGVVVDARETIRKMGIFEEYLTGKKQDIMRFAAAELDREKERAFSSLSDPETGVKWPARKHEYPWKMLQHYGTLKSALVTGWGIRTKNNMPRIFGKVKEDIFYIGQYTRGHGHKPMILVAGANYFGRKYARTAAGWRHSRKRGKWWSYGGGHTGRAASTGGVPPRPFFGFSRSTVSRFRLFALRKLISVFE